LERYPRLKIVIVENEVGWIPFMLQQWDYYYRRTNKVEPLPISMEPSQYFRRQVYVTFIKDSVYNTFLKDAVRENNFDWWGIENCMWSSDFPHQNSTWPDSRKVIQKDLGHLPVEARRKLLCTNVARLYGMEIAGS
jgi:predicted TIM-barrel fold metal-dependent hydrolase